MRFTSSMHRRCLLIAALLCLVSATGCGVSHYPVYGTVTLEDGTPLTRGLVVFETEPAEGQTVFMARGEVKSDGSYRLSTSKPGDGVPAGKYRVLISPMDLSDLPDEEKKLPFDNKYLHFDTSGLRFEVKSGSNEYPIRLAKAKKR